MTVSSKELIELVNKYEVVERLEIVEAILKNIREESDKNKNPLQILEFAGIFKDEEVGLFENAVEESRK